MFIQQFFNSLVSWKYLSNYVLCKMHLNRMLLFFSPCNYCVSHLVFHSTMYGGSGFSLLNVFMLAHCTLFFTLLCVLLLRHYATWLIGSVPFPVWQGNRFRSVQHMCSVLQQWDFNISTCCTCIRITYKWTVRWNIITVINGYYLRIWWRVHALCFIDYICSLFCTTAGWRDDTWHVANQCD